MEQAILAGCCWFQGTALAGSIVEAKGLDRHYEPGGKGKSPEQHFSARSQKSQCTMREGGGAAEVMLRT